MGTQLGIVYQSLIKIPHKTAGDIRQYINQLIVLSHDISQRGLVALEVSNNITLFLILLEPNVV